MPAAKNRDELLSVYQKEYDKLMKTLSAVDAEMAVIPSKEDPETIKDVIAHRTHWVGLYLGWYQGGVAGKDVQVPADGYKWNQLKAYNAKLREASQPVPWDTVLAEFIAAHDALTELLTSLDNEALYTKNLYPWMNNWTLGRWAESAGPSHCRSANKYVRKILREQR